MLSVSAELFPRKMWNPEISPITRLGIVFMTTRDNTLNMEYFSVNNVILQNIIRLYIVSSFLQTDRLTIEK